ncbi:MAG TPA: endonuclease/exonuclease/phosphatase family protein [Paludibacter sp.]|nr:endonuclease/exonuclease/phosphatase family protein [Paludibacter sp.]
MKKQLFIIALLMINFSTQLSAANPKTRNYLSNDSTGLKILSWNIYMLPYISLFNSNAKRAKTIADKLSKSDYQIIVFQEAFSNKCRNILAANLLADYPYQYGPANKNFLPFRTNSGLWIVSKIPLTKLEEFQFSRSEGFDAVARKGAVLFEGSFKGAKFQLLATHLQADFSHTVRDKQCAEIKEHLLNKYYREDIPQFICGDFNIEMDDSPNYEQMLRTLDAQNGELSGNVKVTYDEVHNNLAKTSQGKCKVIDYVLVRNAALVHNVERRVQTFLAHIGGRTTNLSDHYAMEFHVDFLPAVNNPVTQMVSVR